MKVLSIDKNSYGRLFVSIEIQRNESCLTRPFVQPGGLSFYPVSPDGEYYAIRVEQHRHTALTGRTIGYGNTWAVGCGSGAAMGWSLGHSLEEAVNAARAFCATIESFNSVARVHLNLPDRMEAYLDDPCTTPQAADIRSLFDPDFVPLKRLNEFA